MDFSSLITQLSSLENQNKSTEQKLLTEQSAHSITKQSLEELNNKIADMRKKEIELIEKIASLECENMQFKKKDEEYANELSSANKNLITVREHFNKEIENEKRKRENLFAKLEEIGVNYRNSLACNAELNQKNEELEQKLKSIQNE